MTDWKAITLNYTDLQSYDDTVVIPVCLTQRKIAVLKALLITAYWQTRWTDITTNYDTLEKWVAEIDYLLDGNECSGGGDVSIFRENPLDKCEVQYSNDNGVTWHTMFRKDGCVSPPTQMSVDVYNTSITTITTNNTNYAGDILNVAPAWAYDPLTTDLALCWTVRRFVDILCDARSEQLTANETLLNIASIAETVYQATVAALTGIAGYTGFLPGIVGGAFALALGELAFGWIESALPNDKALYDDETARETVACWMFFNIKGATPNFSTWSTALDDFTGGDNAENAIVDLLKTALPDVDIFINFLMALEDITNITALLPGCGCPARWSHTWDFENVGIESWVVQGSYGIYTPGVGVVAQDRLLSGYHSMLIDSLTLPEVVPRCDSFGFTMDMVRGSWASNTTALSMTAGGLYTYTANSGFAQTGNPGWTDTFPLCDPTYMRITTLRSCFTTGTNWGSVVVKSITLQGEGVDPFRHRVTS